MSRITVRVGPADGALQLGWPGAASSGRLAARVLLEGGAEHVSEAWRPGDREGEYATTCGPLDITLRVKAAGNQVRLALRARASRAARVLELGLRLKPLLGRARRRPRWLVYSGHQSWDASGVASLQEGTVRSWWTAGLALDDGGGLAVSALSAVHASTRFDFDGGALDISSAEPGALEPAPVLWRPRRGGTFSSDPIALSAGRDVRAELRRVAAGVRARPADAVPRGWLSWYHHGPWITREEVLQHAGEISAGRLGGLGYSVLQVDDGWQEQYGDWVPNEKFPGGLAAVAADIEPLGLRLGVWTAPFLVAATSSLAAAAPDSWFVKDPHTGGRAVDPVHLVFGPMHVLDPRHPEVREHLRDTFRRLRSEGVRYFKIDFLYAGGYAGTRALRAGLRAIREGAGEDAYLLACGAPLLPAAGICEGCRIGRDTATPVFDFELGISKPTLIGDEIADVARNLAARHFLDSWFQLDPDVALVGGNLTPAQARTCVTFCALSGGPFFASDAIAGLEPERLRLLTTPAVLDLVGGRPATPDWAPSAADRAASIWRRDGVVAVFNWQPEPSTVEVELAGSGPVTDLWSGDVVGRAPARIELEVAPLDARLVRHQPD